MSFEAVGLVIALSIYGTVKLTQFAAESVGRMRRRSAVRKAEEARAVHAAAEERRREDAMEALKAVDGDIARSAESFMKEIRTTETRMEEERRAELRRLDAEWDASMKAIESKAKSAPDALLALTDFHRKRSAELTASMAKASKDMELKLGAVCSDMGARTTATLTAAGEKMARMIGEAEIAAEERTARYTAFARTELKKAEDTLAWIKAYYDVDRFAPGELAAAEAMIAGVKGSLETGAVAAAASDAAMAIGMVQQLHVTVELCTSAFARSKARLAEAAAMMMDQAEASRVLLHPGDPEELEEFVTDETDADFWSEGRLQKLWDRAEEARREAEDFDPRGDAELLALRIGEIQRELMSEYTRTRLMLMSRHEMLQMAKKIIEAHEENGWKISRDPEYVNGDARRSLRLYFVQEGDERMVTIKSRYNPRTGLYEQQLVRHVEEAGMPDEAKRRADDAAINETLTSLGVHDAMKVTCKGETIGMRQSLSDVIDEPDDTATPVRRSAT